MPVRTEAIAHIPHYIPRCARDLRGIDILACPISCNDDVHKPRRRAEPHPRAESIFNVDIN